MLESLRQRLDDWISSTNDLGYVKPERRMVESLLWRGKEQPATFAATASIQDGHITIQCTTPGASIGFRFSEDAPWNVYTSPVPAGDAAFIEILTHRIGFRPTTVRLDLRALND